MAEDIIIRYRAETDEFLKELNVLIDKQDQLADEAEKTSKSFDKSATNEVQAAKRRQQAIESELKNIERLKQARARAFDPVLIDRFNRQISESEKRIKSLGSAVDKAGKETVSAFGSAGSQIKNIGLGIAAGFGAAFTVDAIVNFAKQAVNGFLQAQEEAQKLEFAITSIGGESQDALDRLTAQAEKLAEITYFDDDDIKRAQSALSAFGLTADQIEELVPKLVDFAVVTGQDVVSAAQQVGAGLEGAGREFKKYGIQVDAASTKAENLSKITEGLVKFQGAASDALKTQAGQIKDLNAEYGELQETIGGIILSKLGEFFTKVKQSLTPFADAVLGLAKALGIVTGEGSRLDGFGQIASKVFSNIGKAIEPVFTLLGNLINSLTEGIRYVQAFAQAFVVAFNEIGKTILNVGGGIGDVIGGIFTFDSSQVKAGLDEIKGSVGKFGTDVKKAFTDAFGDGLGEVVKEQAKSVQAIVAQSEKLFTTDELRKKTLQELIALQKEYSKVQTNAGRQNLEAIEKELALKKAQYDKEVELRKKAQEERKKIDDQAFEEFKRNLFAEQDEVLRFLNETEKKAKERELLFEFEVRFKAATEGEDAALEFARQKLFETYQQELQSAELTSDTVEEANAKKQKAYEEYIANSEKLLGGFSIFEQNNAEDTAKAVEQTWIERNEEILRTSLDLFQQLSTLSNTFTQQRIEDLNLQLEKVQEVEEAQLTALEESKEKRLISEADFEKRSAAIKQQRIAAEKKIQAEINKQKRKQAILEKANAAFEIILNTAIAISKALGNLPLQALIAALGAAQLATVIAQPIPAFAKGTKGKKGSGMALVGEEGAEMTFLPDGAKVLPAKQTKTYGEVFDAMYDNRFEKYVMQKYVAPALEEQKRKYEGRKQESFASNIVNSMQYNGITTSDLLYANSKGTKVKNADEIAQAIAKALKTQSPDLWRM